MKGAIIGLSVVVVLCFALGTTYGVEQVAKGTISNIKEVKDDKGKVTSVTFDLKAGKKEKQTLTIVVNPDTKITDKEVAKTVADLKDGMEVSVTYSESGGKLVASAIRVVQPRHGK